MSKENWEVIPNHPEYWVSTLGRILSFKRCKLLGNILKPYSSPKKYLHIDLDNISYSVHRIVLGAWNPSSDKLQVNHKDLDRTNNKLSNLEWVTNRENTIHAWDNGRVSFKGEQCGQSILTYDDVLQIKKLKGVVSGAELGRRYGVHSSAIYLIFANKNWRHVPWP